MSDTLAVTPASGGARRRPGDTLDVVARWTLSRPRDLQARLFWFTRGMGTTDVSIVESKPVVSQASAQGEQSVSFTLPPAPYSFSGRLISLIWAVELVAGDVEAGRWEFVLAPDGAEIVLTPFVDAPRLR